MGFKTYLNNINEDAILNTEGLGLFFYPADNLLGLFTNVDAFKQFVDSEYEKKNPIYNKGLEFFIGNIILSQFKDENCVEVYEVHAKKGYGPLLYLLAMECVQTSKEVRSALRLLNPNQVGLSPFRKEGYITNNAKNIWKNFYDGKGSAYTKHQPLKNKYHPTNEPELNCRHIITKNNYFGVNNMLDVGDYVSENDDKKIKFISSFFDYILTKELEQYY